MCAYYLNTVENEDLKNYLDDLKIKFSVFFSSVFHVIFFKNNISNLREMRLNPVEFSLSDKLEN